MKTIFLTLDDIAQATLEANELNKRINSFTQGKKTVSGMLGERAFQRHYPEAIRTKSDEIETRSQFDFLFHGKRIDVKTQETAFSVKPHYDVNVKADFLQRCDVYFFTRVIKQNGAFVACQLLGYMERAAFFQKATLLKVGDYFRDCDRKVSHDVFVVRVSELNQIKRL